MPFDYRSSRRTPLGFGRSAARVYFSRRSAEKRTLRECPLLAQSGHPSHIARNRSRSGPTLMQINALCCACLKLFKRNGEGYEFGCIGSAKIVQVCCHTNYRSVLGDQCFRSCECSFTQVVAGCGAGRTRVNGVCVARPTKRHARRCARWNGSTCAHYLLRGRDNNGP